MERRPRTPVGPTRLPDRQSEADHAGLGNLSSLSAAPWRALGPGGMVELRRPVLAQLLLLRSCTTVCLLEDRPLARLRLRRLARRTGLVLQRELIAVPTARHPLALVDDDADAVRHFWSAVATVPPGLARAALPVAASLALARRLPWGWTGAMLPGRVVIGKLP